MKAFKKMINSFQHKNRQSGFTLIELLVAIAIASILLVAIYQTYRLQQKSYRTQSLVVESQQNARGAMYVLERDLRMAGYDRTNSNRFGITDIREVNGYSAIEFTSDFNENGSIDSNETISFAIYDYPIGNPDGIPDLGRNSGGGMQLLAEGIEGIGLSYAYEGTTAGELATNTGGDVIWAVDTDNDNDLDEEVDTGDSISPNIPLGDIRAIRIQILARTKYPDFGFNDNETYVLGRRTITPSDHPRNYQRRFLTTIVNCRNLGL
jgi:type IV pilus assembly protein PilW